MATPVVMPKQGQSVETCVITTWLKKKGDQVSTGDLLFSYETDKAAFDMESPANGILIDIFFNEGDEVPVLTNVAVLGSTGENTDSFRPSGKRERKPEEQSITIMAGKEKREGILQDEPGGKIKISPRAKILAEEKGVDISSVSGTGPAGRIIVQDIENAISGVGLKVSGANHPAPDFTDQPLSNVRKLISRAMHSSLQNSAQLTHHISADVRKLLEVRQKIKNEKANGSNIADITINDMVCWCVIRALKKFPVMNSHFLDNRIRTFKNIHLGLAVDTPRGLMVPSVRNADTMDLKHLSQEMKSVAEACRRGNVNPELLQGNAASFTVSNLGNYGVEMFTPVLNLPQAGILGVCTILYRPADTGNNVFGFVPFIGLSLTYDHRAVDGGPATLFLKEIKEQIERFEYNK
jgi:pyruvate dehydrogenase E2 component (dihydrolipoamide acetyltransferase)